MQKGNYILPENVEMAKSVSIQRFLQSEGFNPVAMRGNQLLYLSPLRTEKTASFYVHPQKNRFCDQGGSNEKGDVIRLTQLLLNFPFKQAVEHLLDLDGNLPLSFSFSGPQASNQTEKGIQVLSVNDLMHPRLLQYVTTRGISIELAKLYLKEVTTQGKDRQYFYVGFKNDSGGYELRNGLNFKGGKTLNDITTFDLRSESVVLFEGSFDFLSALEYYGHKQPANTTIVLNTCNNLNKALPLLANRKLIHCFLDNDETGRKTVQRLKNEGLHIRDWSLELYPNSKDFNDFLINYYNGGVTNSY